MKNLVGGRRACIFPGIKDALPHLILVVIHTPSRVPGKLFPRPALLEYKVKSGLEFFAGLFLILLVV